MNIGNLLKELRLGKDLKQIEVAKKIDISPVAYSRYEANKRQPDFDILLKMSKLFNVEIGYFFEEEFSRNEYSLIRIIFREYLNVLKELFITTDELKTAIMDSIGKETIEYMNIVNKLKLIYFDVEAKKIELLRQLEILPFDLYIDKILGEVERMMGLDERKF